MDWTYTIWIPLILLFTFLVTGLLGGHIKAKLSGLIGTGGMLVSTILSYYTAYQYFLVHGKVNGVYEKIKAFEIHWLSFTDTLNIDMGIILDPISVMMLIVITTVSLMVHIYSFGYMEGEEGFARFYSFLSLFSFSMLALVLASNLFQVYMFWELVGVSSYLLIGFYYTKPSAVAASKKAFIVTRFADLGFLVGILVISYITGTFDLISLTDPAGTAITQGSSIVFLGLSVMSWALILIFIGGAGKSAMFPLHIWLPDAMEGPTPVSALIHAATMVVAGVFLVARLFPIYHHADPTALVSLEIVAIIGGLSSLIAAIIACTQTDIKRILAYSTMSQIGYMMLALGVSKYGGEAGLGYMASMFHLFTHAMFKALLFLGAGAIIHAVHSNDMIDMGGLRKYMPITHITFLIACLAIAGIPPLSGFFSKDEILVAAYNHNVLYFWIEWAVAGLTAFYMFRLYFSVFWGKEQNYEQTPHEAPWSMTIPLVFLAVGAAGAGLIPFEQYVTSDGIGFDKHMHMYIALPSIGIALAGIIVAYVMYKKETELPSKLSTGFKGLYTAAHKKFYVDEVYLYITKNIIFNVFASSIAWVDRYIVDGVMNLVASLTNILSFSIRGLQSGQLQQYAFVFVSSVLVMVLAIIYMLSI